MVAKKGLRRVALLLLSLTVAGGVLIAFVVPSFASEFAGLPAASPIRPGTTVIGAANGSVQDLTPGGESYGATSGGSSVGTPSTFEISGTTVTETATSTIASSQTSHESQSGQSNVTSQASSGNSIEFFGNLTESVADPSTALQKSGAVAESLGGYVAYSTYSTSVAEITVRVPYQSYQQALTQLESLGAVVTVTSSSNDVTVQYEDLNATLQSLLTEQASLLRLLNESNTVNGTLEIESVLQQTDAQINSVESTIMQTSQLINYATITVDFLQAQSAYTHMSIKLTATPLKGMNPLSVTFDAVVKGGEPSYFVNYNFGDGTSAQGLQLIHQFTTPGSYNVTVSATDQTGNVSQAWIVVTVTSPPLSSGLGAFGSSLLGLFTRVVGAIVEVAVVVIPVGIVAYLAFTPFYRRYSRSTSREGRESQAPLDSPPSETRSS